MGHSHSLGLPTAMSGSAPSPCPVMSVSARRCPSVALTIPPACLAHAGPGSPSDVMKRMSSPLPLLLPGLNHCPHPPLTHLLGSQMHRDGQCDRGITGGTVSRGWWWPDRCSVAVRWWVCASSQPRPHLCCWELCSMARAFVLPVVGGVAPSLFFPSILSVMTNDILDLIRFCSQRNWI